MKSAALLLALGLAFAAMANATGTRAELVREKGRCPECDTVCKDPLCHTECSNPQPVCESVCEEPVCDWKCHRPSNCPKPKCALVCEKSPHCQEQPAPPADCCPCEAEAAATEVATITVEAPAANKCCGCNAEAAAPASEA